jgi:hypothetical protein
MGSGHFRMRGMAIVAPRVPDRGDRDIHVEKQAGIAEFTGIEWRLGKEDRNVVVVN